MQAKSSRLVSAVILWIICIVFPAIVMYFLCRTDLNSYQPKESKSIENKKENYDEYEDWLIFGFLFLMVFTLFVTRLGRYPVSLGRPAEIDCKEVDLPKIPCCNDTAPTVIIQIFSQLPVNAI